MRQAAATCVLAASSMRRNATLLNRGPLDACWHAQSGFEHCPNDLAFHCVVCHLRFEARGVAQHDDPVVQPRQQYEG
ncbi:hypothetical protein GCM10010411_72400 [Actinomadura fulvescens]|uniref:Uncharacterized protein n=1 Tax=Actinomadura fulvescens TaxID=46160 RepID=A0ABN3QFQ4_9ACTN